MNLELKYKTDVHRRLCIEKDLSELGQWIDSLSAINDELSYLKLIEKQLIKDHDVEVAIQGLRRKNTLLMGTLCKYEQQLNAEHEYGKTEYNITRAKSHENKRAVYTAFQGEFRELKIKTYKKLLQYHRR